MGSSLYDAEDLAEYIAQNYTGRVVEVGAGHMPDVALAVRARGLDVLLTDREEGLAAVADDIFSPKMEIYRGASLLYSIRPPLELQLAMGQVAARTGADVLVRPLGDEVAELPGLTRRLVNFGQARFFLFVQSSR
ncbi:MAG TPA: UPF0146 family protein [Methanothrix sp.]|nr:hypothetical protein [Methanothrix sp.]HOV81056.1 UPF0146 family protein [Methanothrix sp.]HPC88880.1 UPF0146 family protein [Methanothrix sp.]HQE86657.1 UPF0146 family protein [Methanothrix sp.]HQI67187.1 UPF0146 family protein [Methanothrix sp.]